MSAEERDYDYEFEEISPEREKLLEPIEHRFAEGPQFLLKLIELEDHKRKPTDKEISLVCKSLVRFIAWNRLALEDGGAYQRMERETLWRLQEITQLRMNDLNRLYQSELTRHKRFLAQEYRTYCSRVGGPKYLSDMTAWTKKS